MPRPATSNGVTRLAPDRWRWRVMVDGVRYTGVATSEAAAKLARARAELDNGGAPVHDPTVAELLEAHIAESKRAETTLANWRWAHECLPAPFLARRAVDVNPQVVAALWRQLRSEPPHRLVKLANLCSTAWQEALKLGVVATNPFRVIPPPTPPRSVEIHPPDAKQVQRLIAGAEPWFRLWLLIASQTGARGGEVCGLQWDDLDPVTGEVIIRRNITRTGRVGGTKTGVKGQRRVALDDDALDAWGTHRTLVCRKVSASTRSRKPPTAPPDPSPPSRWVFGRDDGEAMRPDNAAQRLATLCEQLELDISPHDLRHFAVTNWLAMGVSIPDVAASIGDNAKTVMATYAHHIPSNRRDMVRRLAKMIRDA